MGKIIQGDCLDVLKTLPDRSVDMCLTSPPYYLLRDYGIEGQIGLEETPEQYIEKLVDVFREVKRVLKDDGTLWVNIGDSYAGGQGRWGGMEGIEGLQLGSKGSLTEIPITRKWKHPVIKQKDLIGIPWMLAFALRADGWYLRQDIIWHKPNPMPESVRDRCTKSHEYIFMLSKTSKYYFDYEAIREKSVMVNGDSAGSKQRDTRITHGMGGGNSGISLAKQKLAMELAENGYCMRNKRDVWTVNVANCKEAHFATFPENLIKPCILAGCRLNGIVLDPFFGSGTTGRVAESLNRDYIGIELNPEYIEIGKKRTDNIQMSLVGLI